MCSDSIGTKRPGAALPIFGKLWKPSRSQRHGAAAPCEGSSRLEGGPHPPLQVGEGGSHSQTCTMGPLWGTRVCISVYTHRPRV